MKKGLHFCLGVLVLSAMSGSVLAQDSDYHPALSDNFFFTAGAFRSDNSFKIRADGTEISPFNEDIDFDDSLGVDNSSTLLNVQLRWNFGKGRKWSLWGQYFANNATGEAALEEDVEWQDVIFREGTFIGAGVKLEVIRAFVGRSFVKNEQHDFGVGIGIHNLDLETYIEGDILVDDETTDFFRGEVSGSQPLPNIGAWYNYSPAKKWLLHGRVDWISANIGDYDGTLWNTNLGVNYQAFRHVGFDLSYQYFELNLTVDKSDWRGGVDMIYSGPVLSVTVNW
jgi:hypothetical protein